MENDPIYNHADELRRLTAEFFRPQSRLWGFDLQQVYPVVAIVTRAVEAVLTIQARHRLGSIKLLSQTVDPLYRPGEYQECVLDSISQAGIEYADPSFEPLVVALRFLRNVFELRKQEMVEVLETHEVPLDFRKPVVEVSPSNSMTMTDGSGPRPATPTGRYVKWSLRSSKAFLMDDTIDHDLLDRYCRLCRHIYMHHVDDVIHRIQGLVDAERDEEARSTVPDDLTNEEQALYGSFCVKPEWLNVIEGREIRSWAKYTVPYEFPYTRFTSRQLTRAIVAFKEERYSEEDMEHIFTLALNERSCFVHWYVFQGHLAGKGPYEKNEEAATRHFQFIIDELAEGNPEAQYVMGYHCWYDGFLTENKNLSVMWYMRAAAQGLPAAIRNLGLCFQSPNSIDYSYSMELLMVASSLGDSRADFSIANAYYLGDRGVEVDYEKAIAAFERDIEFSGRRCSMRRMGEICYFGKGVEVDLQKAKEWFLQAAAQGDVFSNAYLGDLYYYEYGLGEDLAQAASWYQKAADKNNYYGYLGLGFIEYNKRGNFAAAVVFFEQAARLAKHEQDPDAWYMLGLIYGLKYQNAVKAGAYYERAAVEGRHTDACYMLAELHSQEGCERSEYMKWCELASDLGHRYSQFILAAYSLGDKSYARRQKVIENYLKAGKAGTGMAYTHLGHLYYEGFLVSDKQDIREALDCYRKATVASNPDDEARTWAQFIKYKCAGSLAGRYWTPQTHVLYSEKFRRAAMTLLLIHRRGGSPLARLPLEMVHQIIRCMQVDIPEKLPLFPSIMGVIKGHYHSLEADVEDMVAFAKKESGSALLWGCKHDNLDVVLKAIDDGELVSVSDARGYTPLHIAADKGNEKLVVELLKRSASVYVENCDGRTPIQLAIRNHRDDVVEMLIKQSLVPPSSLPAAIDWAKEKGKIELLWAVLQKTGDIEKQIRLPVASEPDPDIIVPQPNGVERAELQQPKRYWRASQQNRITQSLASAAPLLTMQQSFPRVRGQPR